MIINESEKAWGFGQFVGERGIGHRNYNNMFSGGGFFAVRCNDWLEIDMPLYQ